MFVLCVFILNPLNLFSQYNETVYLSPLTSHGEDLDLSAVMTVFKESINLEGFEQKLNEPNGINNLDINNDGYIDYIRVVEEVDGNHRLVILQALLGDNQSQDVAVLNIERESNNRIRIQCEGNVVLYGNNYYVDPPVHVHSNIYRWSIWETLFAPRYVVYHSPWRWSHYPQRWHRHSPVVYETYYKRTSYYANHGGFVYTKYRAINHPYYNTYKPRTSTYVVKKPARNIHRHTVHRNTNTHNRTTVSRTNVNRSSTNSNRNNRAGTTTRNKNSNRNTGTTTRTNNSNRNTGTTTRTNNSNRNTRTTKRNSNSDRSTKATTRTNNSNRNTGTTKRNSDSNRSTKATTRNTNSNRNTGTTKRNSNSDRSTKATTRNTNSNRNTGTTKRNSDSNRSTKATNKNSNKRTR